MEDIFYHHVLPYISHSTFHASNLSLLNKHDSLQTIQKRINKVHSAHLLNERFWTNEMRNIMHVFLEDFHMFLRYIVEILLKDMDMEIISDTCFVQRRTMFVSKYVYSNTILEYDSNQKLVRADFTSCQDIIYDTSICSTYRLGKVQKQVLLDNYPHAKALIY